MLEHVRNAVGEVLDSVRSYTNDAGRYWSNIQRFDKFERRQDFREPDDPSWQSFAAAHWDDSLRKLQMDRPRVVAEFAEDTSVGLGSFRVRVVEFPITPYVQWELHALKIRAECGENIRIISPGAIGHYETGAPVPELIFMGKLAMYEVVYDEFGVLRGARKFFDSKLIEGCLADVQSLYGLGEELGTFFEREVAPLPPPSIGKNPVDSQES